MLTTQDFPTDFQNYLHQNTLIGIKGGRERGNFLNIWMVEVDGRYFSRSWNKSTRSWFTEFLRSGEGQIKYGENVLDVLGQQLFPNDPVQEKINLAYLQKYDQPENIFLR
ncbi:DUF2255 family protein [Salinimicrobium sp. HB62]|uniref:DUF2255 family protein n=1 Tax=Salinimicrobium sp. HB62 TaxID=3077781 RepID=UPI002D769835|nr:DUF2255 family protein [Salinimicrobium sp. HB62]